MRSFYHSHQAAKRRSSPFLSLAAAAAGLTLLACGATRADTVVNYRSAPLVMSGDRFGDLQIPANDDLFVGGLTDTGKLVFSTGNASGTRPAMLLQWDGKTSTPIVAPASGPASAYTGDIYWPHNVSIDPPVSMNDAGNVVFTTDLTGTFNPWGTFLWDDQKQKVTPIALREMPATGNRIFQKAGSFGPAINNHNEVAMAGWANSPNAPGEWGLFLRTGDGALRPVVLSGEQLPNGSGYDKVAADPYFMPSLNDEGAIAFLARPHGRYQYNAYEWYVDGDIQPLVIANRDTVGSETITSISGVFLNNHDNSALVTATTNGTGYSHYGLYRVRNGQISAVAAPGRTMPDGGKLATIQHTYTSEDSTIPVMGVSCANGKGQYAFLAKLDDGSTAAYRVDPNGHLTLIVKGSPATGTVHIAAVTAGLPFVPGSRPCLNNRGQVALSVRVAGGHSLIMLLTPISPPS